MAAPASAQQQAKPNILFIMGDAQLPGSPSYLRPGTPALAKFLIDLGRPWWKEGRRKASDSRDPVPMYPITGIAACCARAASGHATAVRPTSAMNSRRFIDRESPHMHEDRRARCQV
jgi:hypothetical protein